MHIATYHNSTDCIQPPPPTPVFHWWNIYRPPLSTFVYVIRTRFIRLLCSAMVVLWSGTTHTFPYWKIVSLLSNTYFCVWNREELIRRRELTNGFMIGGVSKTFFPPLESKNVSITDQLVATCSTRTRFFFSWRTRSRRSDVGTYAAFRNARNST
jgi:hypothetical protein